MVAPHSKSSKTYTTTTASVYSAYERLIKHPEEHPTLFDEGFLDDGPGSVAQPFDEQEVGEKYVLSCPICEGPMETLLLSKDYETIHGPARPTEFSYSITSKECDCPTVLFLHNFAKVRVIKET
jgi:hypothetical protein